jgi:predicted Zn-dependent protease
LSLARQSVIPDVRMLEKHYMKKNNLLVFTFFFILFGKAYSKEVTKPTLGELKQQADSVLNLPNVSARGKIDVVFELADRLLEAKQSDLAEKYLSQGLQHYPWDLEHQIVYAKLLTSKGKSDLSRETADIVLKYAETGKLIEEARQLLGMPPLSSIPNIQSLPGTNYCVVLIPFQGCEDWLMFKMQEKLSETLGVPVHVQRIAVKYPPFDRDRRGQMLNQMRSSILGEGLKDPQVKAAMTQLKLSKDDLGVEKNLISLMKRLLAAGSSANSEQFDAALEESAGKNPQWNADHLQTLLFQSVKPYRRDRTAYLGVTSEDIYADDYNFLFGWASRQGGIMSYRRFTAAFNNENPNQPRLLKRATMQALSSIGLIYGVVRCTNPTCARAYPNSLSEHDAKEGTLCPQCKKGFKNIFEPIK